MPEFHEHYRKVALFLADHLRIGVKANTEPTKMVGGALKKTVDIYIDEKVILGLSSEKAIELGKILILEGKKAGSNIN